MRGLCVTAVKHYHQANDLRAAVKILEEVAFLSSGEARYPLYPAQPSFPLTAPDCVLLKTLGPTIQLSYLQILIKS